MSSIIRSFDKIFPIHNLVVSRSTHSPLRYPGGKSKISTFLEDLILLNNLENGTIYELYAGGAGASLNLLFSGVCKNIVLNDLDYRIYSFWRSILQETTEFNRLVENTAINIEEYNRQKHIYTEYENYNYLEVGFSTFYLNRCNRSGILSAGPIGGKNQNGNYKIDVRFNKADLMDRISMIGDKKGQIEIRNEESLSILKSLFENKTEKSFLFLDPPYYKQGEKLYFNSYNDENHSNLANFLKQNQNTIPWFLTYDNCKEIQALYKDCRTSTLPMTYTLQRKMKAKEIMVFSKNLHLPYNIRMGKKSHKLIIKNESIGI